MIECGAIYTLIGSKPIVAFHLIPVMDENEKREIYLSKTDQFRQHISYEKFQPCRDDYRYLWNEWTKIQDKYLGCQFLLREDEDWNEAVFVNIPSAQYILTKYYDDFVKHTKMSYIPEEAVRLLGEDSASFWKKVKKSHYLLGLLMGYGEKNSYHFEWESKNKTRLPSRKGTSSGHSGKSLSNLSIQDLTLPTFITYQPIDEKKEQYKLERERCIEIYSQGDFVELTVGFLQGIQPEREPLSEESLKRLKEWGKVNTRIAN